MKLSYSLSKLLEKCCYSLDYEIKSKEKRVYFLSCKLDLWEAKAFTTAWHLDKHAYRPVWGKGRARGRSDENCDVTRLYYSHQEFRINYAFILPKAALFRFFEYCSNSLRWYLRHRPQVGWVDMNTFPRLIKVSGVLQGSCLDFKLYDCWFTIMTHYIICADDYQLHVLHEVRSSRS